MAMPVEPLLVGVDVAKAELVFAEQGREKPFTLRNERGAIRAYLESLPGLAAFAVEATNTFHLELIEQAHRLGHTVYVIDALRLERYRQGVGGRAKTDHSDAKLLLRYLQREREDLRPWSPPPAGYARVQGLLRRRARLVQAKVMLRQSLSGLPCLKNATKAALQRIERLESLIQKRIEATLIEQGWMGESKRVQALEGVGELTAAALVMAYRRGRFKSSDAFIAFLGLDVRVRESGTYSGRRRLTKKGDPELRRLLYLAAMTASRSATWRSSYEHHLERGLSRVQAMVILARKLARVAFALLRNQTSYHPKTV